MFLLLCKYDFFLISVDKDSSLPVATDQGPSHKNIFLLIIILSGAGVAVVVLVSMISIILYRWRKRQSQAHTDVTGEGKRRKTDGGNADSSESLVDMRSTSIYDTCVSEPQG